MTDQDFIHALQRGDEDAFRRLIAEHQQRLYRLILGFVRDTHSSEDLCQEVFIEVVESIHGFKREAQLSTWLHRIAVRKCLDYKRSQGRQKRFALLTSLFADDNTLIVDPADPIHPGVLMEDREKAQLLFAAIDRLPEQQRIAYTLCRIDELSVQEAADIMKCSAKAVESLLSRAKVALAKRLQSYRANG